MSVNREWMNQVRAAIADIQGAAPARAPNCETEAWRAYDASAQFLAPPVALDQSQRGRLTRAISRIALRYPWGRTAVEHFLDLKGVGFVADLTDPQLDDLHSRMQGYVDAAEMGCDLDEPLAAR